MLESAFGTSDVRTRWTPWHRDPAALARSGRIPVYCLPHAGGSASVFLPWSKADDQPDLVFVPVELPGRGTRLFDNPLSTMDRVTDELLTVLATRPPGRPFVLLGHSMGAQIAYETARRLTAAGSAPLCLAVSGCRPPGSPRHHIHDLPADELISWLERLGGTPAEVLAHRELMERLLPVMRADLGLLADYTDTVEATPLGCPLLALGGTEDRMAEPAWIAGWQRLTTARFALRIFAGDHFFLYRHATPARAELAACVRTALEDKLSQ
ncbi:thioesterase II family protein [Dactylosporangium sp. NPDC048998]|uniref:thioesterase II family protein n=1 Tax=Dactylosporangium sp. NPDC048998 TaxID=3363976 RepID=UPI003719F7E3